MTPLRNLNKTSRAGHVSASDIETGSRLSRYALSRRWETCKQVGRSGWSEDKVSTAVGASVIQSMFNALFAEGAFERANACLRGPIGQIPVTQFAVWTHFEHRQLL